MEKMEGPFLHVKGLAEVKKRNGLVINLLFGVELLEVQPTNLGFGMPLVRSGRNLICPLDKKFYPVMAIPFMGSFTPEFEQTLRRLRDNTEYAFDKTRDKVFHINIFATRGEGRYPREWLWNPFY